MKKLILCSLAALLVAGQAMATTIRVETAPAVEIANATSYTIIVDSEPDQDLVSFEDVTLEVMGGTVYNLGAPFGSDTIDPVLVWSGVFDPLPVGVQDDSFIQLPNSVITGSGMDTTVLVNDGTDPIQPGGIPLATWADLANTGPVMDHVLARITLIDGPADTPATAILRGTINAQPADGSGGLFPTPIGPNGALFLPEPSSFAMIALCSVFGLLFRRK